MTRNYLPALRVHAYYDRFGSGFQAWKGPHVALTFISHSNACDSLILFTSEDGTLHTWEPLWMEFAVQLLE